MQTELHLDFRPKPKIWHNIGKKLQNILRNSIYWLNLDTESKMIRGTHGRGDSEKIRFVCDDIVIMGWIYS